MDLKKYLCVNAEDITLVNYIFTDKVFYGEKNSYPKPQSIAIGGESSVNIFEENDIPKEFQKLYMSSYSLSKEISKIPYFKRSKTFIARELLTDISIALEIYDNRNIYGKMSGSKPSFSVDNVHECNKEEAIMFLFGLRENGLLDNYLRTLEEIMHIHVKSDFDTNKLKRK